VSEPTQEELQVNRRLLERWRADPEHYARLKRDFRAFMALPADKRDRLRELDHDLREEDASSQARLFRVLDRYATWLDHLPDEDRARIEAAPNAADRLRVVKELREREWIAQLPRAEQKRIEATPADLQPRVIADLRQEERNRHREWQLALWNAEDTGNRSANPARPSEFPPETRLYITATLLPMIGEERRKHLSDAEGKWPDYARLVLEYSQEIKVIKFPPAARPVPTKPFDYKGGEIPEEIIRIMMLLKKGGEITPQDRKFTRKLNQARGKWPDFPLAVHEVAREKNIPLRKPLGPCNLEDFHRSVREFYYEKMLPILKQKSNQEEFDKLTKAAGTWPEYPMVFMDVAQKHKLIVPGTFLGGSKEFWLGVKQEAPSGTPNPE
jgi:hypothetical protein